MTMNLMSVNIGQTRPLPNVKASGQSGIYKQAVSGPIQITTMGLVGDTICDTEHHGGVDQAVYVYSRTDYAWWEDQLGQPLHPGTFGENLTIEGFDPARVQVGDRLHMEGVILEVTAPRVPCVTLAARMGDPMFVKRFRYAERPGFYCRVIQEGYVQQGDSVIFEPYQGQTVSLIEYLRDFYEPDRSETTLRRYLGAPIALRDRVYKEEQLAQLLSKTNN